MVFEFYGCVYGVLMTRMTTLFTMSTRWLMFMRRHLIGYKKKIWEHDYYTLKETDEMKWFLDTFDFVTNLEPHDGFKLFRDAQEGETIEYINFCSLYPFVNKMHRYPISHPVYFKLFWAYKM